jgi:hypothetical protein
MFIGYLDFFVSSPHLGVIIYLLELGIALIITSSTNLNWKKDGTSVFTPQSPNLKAEASTARLRRKRSSGRAWRAAGVPAPGQPCPSPGVRACTWHPLGVLEASTSRPSSFIKTWSHCVSGSCCLSLLSAGITDMHYPTQLTFKFLLWNFTDSPRPEELFKNMPFPVPRDADVMAWEGAQVSVLCVQAGLLC